jgi:hypothetical protein
MDAPPPVVPALVVAFFAAGTAAGYALVRKAIHVRPFHFNHGAQRLGEGVAHARLRQVEASPPRPERYADLASAFRAYLDTRFAIATGSMSGADVERAITRGGCPRPLARDAAQLIERCDAAGSGATEFDPDRFRADLHHAIELAEALSRS